jgi:hypothetical protein
MQYRLLPGEVDDYGLPGTPARICLGPEGTAHCWAPPSTRDYVFGLEPKAVPAGRLEGVPLTLFSAMFSGGGSGTLTDYSLLTVRGGELVNLLPTVRLTSQSEINLWTLPEISALPVLVTAEFIWDYGAKETHFASHRYRITALVYDKERGRYTQRVDYSTAGKYPGLDEVDEIRVLEKERARVLALLHEALGPKP